MPFDLSKGVKSAAPREARPACHRFYVPLAIPAATGKKNLLGQEEQSINAQVVNAECTGSACMLWNPERSECYDKTQARAISRIADNYIVSHGDQ